MVYDCDTNLNQEACNAADQTLNFGEFIGGSMQACTFDCGTCGITCQDGGIHTCANAFSCFWNPLANECQNDVLKAQKIAPNSCSMH